MVRILSVVGARPQFIKAAPVSQALIAAGIKEFLVHTGQHYDREMSDVFFEELGIRTPDANLNIGSGSHGAQTGAMLSALEKTMLEYKPDWVLVYGDTNSTLAGALAAAKLQIPIAHVEAGLRSFNRRMPEEINRVIADALASLLLVPTEAGRLNLQREGISSERIVYTGDVMYDATLMFRDRAMAMSRILERVGVAEGGYVLATVHRAENTDDPKHLKTILQALTLVSETLPVVLPLHPRARARLNQLEIISADRVHIIEPVGFLDMIRLESSAAVVATDSGGVQKEAFFQRAPCVTFRKETEWIELVELGWNRLVPPDAPRDMAKAILEARNSSGHEAQPYGNGKAAVIIAETLAAYKPSLP
jgi:UDP-GlcNAc3NAcA epimerase